MTTEPILCRYCPKGYVHELMDKENGTAIFTCVDHKSLGEKALKRINATLKEYRGA